MIFSIFEVPYITYSFLLKLFSQMCPLLPLVLALSSVLPEFVLCSFLICQSADFKTLPGRILIYSLPQQIYTDGHTASGFKSSHLILGDKTQRPLIICFQLPLWYFSKVFLYNLKFTKAKLDKFYSTSKKFTIPMLPFYHFWFYHHSYFNTLSTYSPSIALP